MKSLMFALLCSLLLALGTVAAACGDGDEGAPATTEDTDAPGDVEGDGPNEPPAEDTVEVGALPAEFGRGSEEAFVLAREACDMWEDWQPDGGEDALAPIATKAAEARAASDVRDPVLEGLDRELSGLLEALQTGEGSGVIALSNRMVGEVCEQVP